MAEINSFVNLWIDKYVNAKQHDMSTKVIALNILEDSVLCQYDADKLSDDVKRRLIPIIGDLVSVDWKLPKVVKPKPLAVKGPILSVTSGYNHVSIQTPKLVVKVDVKGKVRVNKTETPSDSRSTALKDVLSHSTPKVCQSELVKPVNDDVQLNSSAKTEVTSNNCESEKSFEIKVGNVDIIEHASVVESSDNMIGIDKVAVATGSDIVPIEAKCERSERLYSHKPLFVINGKDWSKPYSICAEDVKSFPKFSHKGLMILNHSNCGATYCHLHLPHVIDSSRIVGTMVDRERTIRALVERGFIVVTNNPTLCLLVEPNQRVCYMHKDWEERIIRKEFPGKGNLSNMGLNLLEAKRYSSLYPVIVRDMYLSEWIEKSIIVYMLRLL